MIVACAFGDWYRYLDNLNPRVTQHKHLMGYLSLCAPRCSCSDTPVPTHVVFIQRSRHLGWWNYFTQDCRVTNTMRYMRANQIRTSEPLAHSENDFKLRIFEGCPWAELYGIEWLEVLPILIRYAWSRTCCGSFSWGLRIEGEGCANLVRKQHYLSIDGTSNFQHDPSVVYYEQSGQMLQILELECIYLQGRMGTRRSKSNVLKWPYLSCPVKDTFQIWNTAWFNSLEQACSQIFFTVSLQSELRLNLLKSLNGIPGQLLQYPAISLSTTSVTDNFSWVQYFPVIRVKNTRWSCKDILSGKS